MVPPQLNPECFRRRAVYSWMTSGHPKQGVGTAMDENRISDQVSAATDNVQNGVTSAVGKLSDLAGQARSAAVEAANTIQGAAIETGKQVSDAAAKTYQHGARAGEYVSRNTAEQPLLALLIAGAVGYGIAYMIHRS
jgi:hypothetical protein